MRRISKVLFVAVFALSLAACGGGSGLPISKLVQPVDVKTGWFDAGIEDGKNKLVPTVMLTLKNVSGEQVANVQLNAVIRRVGETEEWGGAYQKVIGNDLTPVGQRSVKDTTVAQTANTEGLRVKAAVHTAEQAIESFRAQITPAS